MAMTSNVFYEMAAKEGSQKENPFYKLASEKKEPQQKTFSEIVQPVKEFGKELGVSALTSFLRSPKDLADFVSFAGEFLAEKGKKQREEKGEVQSEGSERFTQGVLDVLGFPSRLLDSLNYPSEQEFESVVREYGSKAGLDLQKPESPTSEQQTGSNIGKFVGSAALGGRKDLLKRLMLGFLGGSGAEIAKDLDLGVGGEIGASIALPALVEGITQIRSGKFIPSTEEFAQLKEFGKRYAGLSESELVPLLQPSKKVESLSRIAKPTAQTEKVFSNIEEKLGKGYDILRTEAVALPQPSPEKITQLVDKFENINKRLKKSDFPSTEKTEVIKKVDSAIDKIQKEGITAEGIIESWQDINKTVDWNRVRGGKKQLAELKQPYKEILTSIDPEVAKNFEKINQLYSNFKNIEKKIGPNIYKGFGEYGKYASLLGSLVKSISDMNPNAFVAGASTVLGAELAQRVASKALTDPKYQNLLIKGANAIKNSSRSVGLKTFKELSDQINEDFPEEAKKVDWKKLMEDSLNRRR